MVETELLNVTPPHPWNTRYQFSIQTLLSKAMILKRMEIIAIQRHQTTITIAFDA